MQCNAWGQQGASRCTQRRRHSAAHRQLQVGDRGEAGDGGRDGGQLARVERQAGEALELGDVGRQPRAAPAHQAQRGELGEGVAQGDGETVRRHERLAAGTHAKGREGQCWLSLGLAVPSCGG